MIPVSETLTIEVVDGPVLELYANPDSGGAPLPVEFSWNIAFPGGGPYSCTFDAGQGDAPIVINDCNNSDTGSHI